MSLGLLLQHLLRPRETEGGKRIKVSAYNYKDSTRGSEASLALPSYCRKTVLSAEGAAIIACKLIWASCQSGPSPPLLSGRVICEAGEILLEELEERR